MLMSVKSPIIIFDRKVYFYGTSFGGLQFGIPKGYSFDLTFGTVDAVYKGDHAVWNPKNNSYNPLEYHGLKVATSGRVFYEGFYSDMHCFRIEPVKKEHPDSDISIRPRFVKFILDEYGREVWISKRFRNPRYFCARSLRSPV